jgi:hypothetical protein
LKIIKIFFENPTDEQKVEYGAKDSIEDDGPEVAHEHPVVQGVGRFWSISHIIYFATFKSTHIG